MRAMGAGVETLFREAMATLCSGVAVVTGTTPAGDPCGLVATSVSSFSADPPSVLTSVAHASRCHQALTEGDGFGVHVLGAHQQAIAHVFAGLGDDKFAGLGWRYEDGIPRLEGTLAFVRCRRSAVFELYDHTLLVGDVLGGSIEPGDPLVYMSRSMAWRLEPIA
jgi:flavin reductase (DIM6/NTAB) family NADH-FMN oxidoreductase RutF